ncbi:MAG: shikimate dehydrogenase [Acidimicrobiales bacterium]
MSIQSAGRGTAGGGARVVCGLVGQPVGHSLSPRLHNAAYEALGLDWVYFSFDVAPERFASAVSGAAALSFRGLSVTMPHKEQAVRAATRRSAMARKLGAANTLTFEGGEIIAESTDGGGLLDDLSAGLGYLVREKRCGVIGAGGAARAVVLSLVEAGAREVLVVNRNRQRAFRAAALVPERGRVARPEDLYDVDLVVQATPLEMAVGRKAGEAAEDEKGPPRPAGVDPSRLGRGQVVVDMVYEPAETAFLAEAARQGATTRNGLGMLVHQAARQVEAWTGSAPPLAAMWEAVSGVSHPLE